MTPEELKEFNNEWEKSNDWGGGKFGCLEEINDEYCEFIPDKDGTIDFINNLLKSRQEKMIDWLDKQDENLPEYKTIFQTSEEDYCTCDFQNGDIIIIDKENNHTKCGKRFLLSKPIQTSFSKLKEKIISLIKA